MKKNRFGAVVFTLVVGATVAIGCGGNSTFPLDTVSAICQDECACIRCTSNDLAACEDDGYTDPPPLRWTVSLCRKCGRL